MNRIRSTISKLILIIPICLSPIITQAHSASDGIILYTPYTSRSVTPGQDINYEVEVINQTNAIQNVTFSVTDMPDDWKSNLTASANTIQQIAVKPKILGSEYSRDIELNLNIPLKIKKGDYHFQLVAQTDNGRRYTLPLAVNVTEQGIFKTEFEADQKNMEGYTDSDFNYSLTLSNRTAKDQNYALTADSPPGWDVRFKSGGNYVTSVTVASNKSDNIRVNVKTPEKVETGSYKINVRAISGTTSGRDTLETAIKGKYDVDLSTPSGRLSTEVIAGGEKTIQLILKNTGSIPLRDIKLTSSPPADWNVALDNKSINRLNPGETTTIDATIKASDKAIAGDYQLHINAETTEASTDAAFRVTVGKSVTWGSVGILIILLVGGGIAYLVKKYGRR